MSTSNEAEKCTTCPAGYYCPVYAGDLKIHPKPCLEGEYSDEGAATCSKCLAGHYCPNKATTKFEMTVDQVCPAGVLCVDSSNNGIAIYPKNTDHGCPAGSYCPRGCTAAVACPIGTYNVAKARKDLSDCI